MEVGIIEISIALIAIAFTALVYFIIKTLSSVRQTLEQTNQTMLDLRSQVEQLNAEATQLIRNTNELTVDLKQKSRAVDGVFDSIQNLGVATQQMTSSLKQVSTTISNSVQKSVVTNTSGERDKLAEIIQYVTLGMKYWQKWQLRKQNKAEQVHNQGHVSDEIR